MGLFGGKKEEPEIAAQGPPTSTVLAMRQKGLSNHQIVQQLQREGYTTTQVFDAMNQADLKGGVEMPKAGPGFDSPELKNPMGAPPQQMPPPMAGSGDPIGQDPGMQQALQPPPMQEPMSSEPRSAAPLELERIEEIAEAIIDEKWNDLVKTINKIIDWKDQVESRMGKMEQEFTDLKTDFTALHKGILGKVGDYDKNLTNIGTQIQAMEKVFQKTLPTFTENINELNRITDQIKKQSPKK